MEESKEEVGASEALVPWLRRFENSMVHKLDEIQQELVKVRQGIRDCARCAVSTPRTDFGARNGFCTIRVLFVLTAFGRLSWAVWVLWSFGTYRNAPVNLFGCLNTFQFVG